MPEIKINWLVFFISFAIGILYLYLTAPLPRVIYKEPNIDKPEDTIYIDENKVCYRYQKIKVDCK